MLEKYIRQIGFALLMAAVLAGCGYRFAGSGKMPGDINGLFVALFDNRTNETRLGNLMTDAIIFEFTRNAKELMVDENSADAVMQGVIKAISTTPVARVGQTTTAQSRVTVSLDVAIIGKEGNRIWSGANIQTNQAYDVTPAKQLTERNRRDALVLLSEKMAEYLYNRLTDDF
jgi:outer membrane lipopolysaccharide assembly protein LptE/RlpB